MPENSPVRTIDSHPAYQAFELRAREIGIHAETGVDPSKISAKSQDESTRLIIESHQLELSKIHTSVIAHLNDLRHSSERLQNGDEPQEVREFLKLQGFSDEHTEAFIGMHQTSQNGSKSSL